MTQTIDILALANAAAATEANHNEATTGGGGGDYEPPAAGPALARLVGYIEIGAHEKSLGAGKPKENKFQVQLVFELTGKRHPAKVLEDGTKLPIRITETFNASKNYGPLNEKAGLYKVFKLMNYDGKATHMSQLLGKPFLLTLSHNVVGEGDKKLTYVNIRDESGYKISPPRRTDVETGEVTEIAVPPALSALRLFVWNAEGSILKQMWDSLFIDGSYPERKDKEGKVTAPAKSKNVLQEKIKAALNFSGSPIEELLKTNGVVMDLGKGVASTEAAATTPASSTTSPSDDPLAAM